ncbi:RluA family pseudouridine synthase [Pseudodesulfovibrio portus]|uniref:Ribosomal large subunit pseudouridine synthase C n=1 Tax=Pseudodesulfovibrio portus TaxID=231439 RepID=A0ABN6RY45_9BACT|nr:RluA family pseudouridine synthase [Pseudodesulfovibrio portus]BDQ34801.1 pseudouridine synthase [Pseudodesulfovibrio portus]
MPKAQFVIVTPAESGQKLLQFLERRLTGDVPRSAIQKWIRKGQVRVDKGRKKPFDRITAGQEVRIPPYTPGEADAVAITGTTGSLVTVYEDDDILAIAKPAGLAVHGGDKVTDSVAARLKAIFADADFMPTLAHRLDRDTSGLLLAAKNYETLRGLNDLFASGSVGKLYLAWVKGRWSDPDETLLEDRLEKSGAPGAERVRPGSGKTALARVTCLVSDRQNSLLAVRLITGRTHQIRVQLASRNHPVIGDGKYGRDQARGPMRLHCYAMLVREKALSLPPPWTNKWEIPPDALKQALGLLYE